MREYNEYHFDVEELKKMLNLPSECQMLRITIINNEKTVVIKSEVYHDK